MFVLLIAVSIGQAEPALHEQFEGPSGATCWQPVESQQKVRIAVHDQISEPQHPESMFERIALEAPGGVSARFEYPLGQAPVLDELEASLQVKSNRPGVRLAARAVLPRAIDPETGELHTVLVRGTRYEAVSNWQRLELTELPKLVKRQARILRLEVEAPIDHREAYVESIILMVPGGHGSTEVHTDDLQVDGVLLSANEAPFTGDDRTTPAATGVVRAGWDKQTAPAPAAQRLPPRVEIRNSSFQIDGRPFFLRAVRSQGEPAERLAELGFNTILLDELPPAEDRRQAEKLQLWQLCPPPSAEELALEEPSGASDYRRILGWYLDRDAMALPPAQLRDWVDAIRRWDRELNRPIVLAPSTAAPAHQKHVDAVVLGRPAWGNRTALREHGEWLGQQVALTGSSIPTMMQVKLSPSDAARSQAARVANLADEHVTTIGTDENQVDLLSRIAITNGCRGLIVHPGASLETANPLSHRRATALALANLNCQLLEPWLVGGQVTGTATSSNPNVSAVVMQVDRARIVIPMNWSQADRSTVTALTVPGVPESNRVYLLTPASLSPLDHKRVAGGIRIVIDPDIEGFVLMTEDPRVISTLRQRVARNGGRAAQLRADLADARLNVARQLVTSMSSQSATGRTVWQLLSRAGGHLGESKRQLKAGNAAAAYFQATASACMTGDPLISSVASSATDEYSWTNLPLRPTLDVLSRYASLAGSLDTRPAGENRLYGGDFEDLHRLLEFGWKRQTQPVEGIATHVELSATEPYHGKFNLQLSAQPSPDDEAPAVVAQTPVSIKSPPIPVSENELIEISGWVQIDEAIEGNVDGLTIVDSLGGPDLALSIRETSSWQSFRIVRRVGAEREFRFSLDLKGLGTAEVDALMVRALGTPSPRPAPSPRPDPAATVRPPPAARHPATGQPAAAQTKRRRLFARPGLR